METELIQEVAETVNSITPEQFTELMETLTAINNNIAVTSNYIIFAIVLLVVWFTFKLLYSLFGHVFFGGL